MKKSRMPLIVMLLAGAVAAVRTYFLNYTIYQKLLSVFLTLLIFYILGACAAALIARFERQNEQKRQEEEEARLAEEARLEAEAEAERLKQEAENISTAEEDIEEEEG